MCPTCHCKDIARLAARPGPSVLSGSLLKKKWTSPTWFGTTKYGIPGVFLGSYDKNASDIIKRGNWKSTHVKGVVPHLFAHRCGSSKKHTICRPFPKGVFHIHASLPQENFETNRGICRLLPCLRRQWGLGWKFNDWHGIPLGWDVPSHKLTGGSWNWEDNLMTISGA